MLYGRHGFAREGQLQLVRPPRSARPTGAIKAALAAGDEAYRARSWYAGNVVPDPLTDPEGWRRAVQALNAAPGGPEAEVLRRYREHLAGTEALSWR